MWGTRWIQCAWCTGACGYGLAVWLFLHSGGTTLFLCQWVIEGFMELGAVKWILEEKKHVKQILSKSSEMCFPICLYYLYLRSAWVYRLKVLFEETPSCLRHQLKLHTDTRQARCQNPDFPRLAWPEPSLAYQLGVHSLSKSSFLMPTPKPPPATLFFPLIFPLPNYFQAFSILKFPDFFFFLPSWAFCERPLRDWEHGFLGLKSRSQRSEPWRSWLILNRCIRVLCPHPRLQGSNIKASGEVCLLWSIHTHSGPLC